MTDLDAAQAGLRAGGEYVLEGMILRFPAWPSAACFIVDPDGQLSDRVPSNPAASSRD